jgi:UDPglucose 6-dehydrogenase
LRRSLAIELCRLLRTEGAEVRVFDPAAKGLPDELDGVDLLRNIEQAALGSDALVVCTEWPQILESDWPSIVAGLRRALVIDANGFLLSKLSPIPDVSYRCVGKPRNS